jgi:drug/metabolite transporter (DMT)-like permease
MIDLAILFAILSLMLGGLNEVVFKRYSARERSRGMMISGIGVVWILLLACDIALRGDSIEIDRAGLGYGLVAGLIVAVANILLLESLKHMEVSLGSTIYRLNTVGVVILSIVFLGEIMTLPKLSGIVCAVVAVLLLYRHQSSQLQQGELKLGLTLVLIGAICRAVYAVVTKAGLGAGVDMDLLLLTSALCWVLSGLIYARFIERRYAITRQKIAYSLLSGCLVYGIVRTLLAALALGEASVVITIANLSFLMALLLALLLKMESLSGRKLLAMGFAVSAIALLTRA